MATPTITAAAPLTIWSGGQLVTLTGTNFRAAALPSGRHWGPYPKRPPTVAITVAGKPVATLKVWSTTRIDFKAPAGTPGTADVTVQNLDDAGAPIAGEVVTATALIRYARPALDFSGEPDLGRVNRTFVQALRDQLLDNVVQGGVDTDFSEDLSTAEIAKLPALVLRGPDMQRSPDYRTPRRTAVEAPGGTIETHQPAEAVDLLYELDAYTASQAQLVQLQALVSQFFQRNLYIEIPRDPTDSTRGTVAFELRLDLGTRPLHHTTTPNTSNVHSFSCACTIRGVLIEAVAGFVGEDLVEKDGANAETISLAVEGDGP